jgi:ABC-type uncharacterized transport system auxiliary subunit
MTRSYPPPEWRHRREPERGWLDAMLALFVVALVALILRALCGCTPETQRPACSAVGVALTAASEIIVDRMADALVEADTEAERLAVEDRFAPVLAAYESAAAAQNAWADALTVGEVYPVEAVAAAYCEARAALTGISPLPDWPIGGCQ